MYRVLYDKEFLSGRLKGLTIPDQAFTVPTKAEAERYAFALRKGAKGRPAPKDITGNRYRAQNIRIRKLPGAPKKNRAPARRAAPKKKATRNGPAGLRTTARRRNRAPARAGAIVWAVLEQHPDELYIVNDYVRPSGPGDPGNLIGERATAASLRGYRPLESREATKLAGKAQCIYAVARAGVAPAGATLAELKALAGVRNPASRRKKKIVNPGARTDRALADAQAALEDFSGHPAAYVEQHLLRPAVAGWGLGPVVAIEYAATRDGELATYRHEFASEARPLLASSHDGRQLYLLGGAYSVTDRGIADE